MNVGYARTSTVDQLADLKAQERDLRTAGCEKLFSGGFPDPCMGLLKSIADVYACWYFSVLS